MKAGTLAQLAVAGGRTDKFRMTFTAVSSALAAVVLLAAAAVAAVPELGTSDDGSDSWNEEYSSALIREPGLRPGVVLTLLLLAVPVLFLAGQSIRFGSPARDRRLAAMRLAGATPGQAVLVAATETAVAALLGSIVGTGAFLLLRVLLDRRGADGTRPLPTDVLPSALAVTGVLVLVPVLAALIGAVLLRRVIITPLGVVRRVRRRSPRLWPGVLILVGVFAPLLIRPLGKLLARWIGGDLMIAVAFVAVLLAAVGVIVGTGWIAYTAGYLLHRFGRRPATLLAGRQLMADPWNGSRTLAALLATLVVGAGVLGYRAYMQTELAARNEAWAAQGDAIGDPELDNFYLNSVDLVRIAVAAGALVAAAGIMVALAESIVSRRRTYAGLVAAGVPRRVLGSSIAWQTLAPLVPAVLVALTVGVGLLRAVATEATSGGGASCSGTEAECFEGSPSWVQHPEVTKAVPVPLVDLLLLGGGALAVMLLVVGVGLVLLRSSTDLDELRIA
ncbi:permease [Actinoplanes sp. ATCC 53533]|uniref:FtsX-like permease family protein n=1 Tax=Actinoplanes sp. ATCC 53533 TaxID=1288362 RepID=UPI000F7B8149|nr:FtsX-like permease family protein [Actinoplanes sp. ATCC 53533]RSM47936.1 permease [Actinoplanes sp. ATCC 53533]